MIEQIHTEKKGYVISICTDADDPYIPYALHVERDDSVIPWKFPWDKDAARAAEQDGIKLVYGIPHVEDGIYVDTPENRKVLEEYSQMRENALAVGQKQKPHIEELSRQAETELDGLCPTEQPNQAEPSQESGWRFYIIPDLKTWADNAENRSPLEHYSSLEEVCARFAELRGEPYNSEAAEPGPDGQPPARLTLGLESADGMSAADILHVRQGENCLVTDFVWMERLRDDPAVMDILSRISRKIGFDWVRVWEQADGGRQALSIVPFTEWDNPYFDAGTPSRIATQKPVPAKQRKQQK